jgi:hypothetical protein
VAGACAAGVNLQLARGMRVKPVTGVSAAGRRAESAALPAASLNSALRRSRGAVKTATTAARFQSTLALRNTHHGDAQRPHPNPTAHRSGHIPAAIRSRRRRGTRAYPGCARQWSMERRRRRRKQPSPRRHARATSRDHPEHPLYGRIVTEEEATAVYDAARAKGAVQMQRWLGDWAQNPHSGI